MEQEIFLVLGVFAVVWSLAPFLLTIDAVTQAVFQLIAVIFWAFWANSAGRITIRNGGCCVHAQSYPELSILGGIIGLAFFVGFVFQVIEIMGSADAT